MRTHTVTHTVTAYPFSFQRRSAHRPPQTFVFLHALVYADATERVICWAALAAALAVLKTMGRNSMVTQVVCTWVVPVVVMQSLFATSTLVVCGCLRGVLAVLGHLAQPREADEKM